MPFKKNNPGCNCCDFTCLIGADDYNRADADALGTKWVEKTGDWDISSSTLVATTDGDVLTTYRQALPIGTTYNYQVRVDLLDTKTSWGIICKYVSAGNYDWIEVYTSGVEILPRFWRRTGGVDALIMDITTHPAGDPLSSAMPAALSVTVCYSDVEWGISVSPTSWTTCNVSAATALPVDTTVGFVGFNKGDVDNWEYYYHRLSKTDCVQCSCFCSNPADSTDYKCIPETLTLTLIPVITHPDCTDSPATLTYTLRQSRPTRPDPPPPTYPAHPDKHYWYSDPVGLYEPTNSPIYFWFRLECRGNGEFELIFLAYSATDTTPFERLKIQLSEQDGINGGAYNTAVECTPIVITFPRLIKFLLQIVGSPGPFVCDPFEAEEYSVVVTE